MSTTYVNGSASELAWAIERIAILKGRAIERVALQQALLKCHASATLDDQITAVCAHLQWSRPEALKQLDLTQLPALLHSPAQGWLIVKAQTADRGWLCENSQGVLTLAIEKFGVNLEAWNLTLHSPAASHHTAWTSIRSAFLRHKTTFIEGAVASSLIHVVALATSLFSMQVYDRVIPSQGFHTLYVLSIGVLLCIIFEFVLKYCRSRIMEHAIVQIDQTLSRDVFQRLVGIRLDQLPPSVGSLAGQVRAYEGIRALLTASTAFILVDIPFALFFIWVMAALGTMYMASIPLIFLIVSLVTGQTLRRIINNAAIEGARAGNEKTGLLVETVEGAETLKSGNGSWRMLSRWNDISQQSITYDLKIRHASELGGFLTVLFQQISYACLIAVGAWQVIEGHLSMGSLIACSILSGRVLSPAGMLPGLMVQYAHAKAALAGLERIYSLANDNADPNRTLLPDNIKGHYILDSVRYSYQNLGNHPSQGRFDLSIPRLEIQAGEKIAVIGPVGSGKSTLLRLLSGLYQPRDGRILLDNLDFSRIVQQRVSEQLGYLQQEHRLFQGSLRDNLLIGLVHPGDDALMQAASKTGLVHTINNHPLGLDLPISEGGKGLSGGQRQLLALTRLLLISPRIWLLDEPTASMDAETEKHCITVLKQHVTSEHTAIIVTHKPNILHLVDRVIVMGKQTILLDGPRDRVLQQIVDQAKQT